MKKMVIMFKAGSKFQEKVAWKYLKILSNNWLEFFSEKHKGNFITTQCSDFSKEECLHEHATCPKDIRSIKCAYCGKSLYIKPKY